MSFFENNDSCQRYTYIINGINGSKIPEHKDDPMTEDSDSDSVSPPTHQHKRHYDLRPSKEPLLKKRHIQQDNEAQDEAQALPQPEANSVDQEYDQYIKCLSVHQRQRLESIEHVLEQQMRDNNKPLKYQVLTSSAPQHIKLKMMDHLKKLTIYEKNSSDYAHELTTLQQLLKIPWETYAQLPISKNDPPKKIQSYLADAKVFLDSVTYGQHNAKSKLLLEVTRFLEKPDGHGFVLGIKGPPGSGKTTLISNGLAHILNRPFTRIDLGGAKHSDCLFGSRKVFDRSDVGDLVKIICESGYMNPIIFFDELDKISVSEYGHELVNALNDLTDVTRNCSIVDQYLGVPIDLSKAIFVFAYNSSDCIQETLRSRIHEIEIESYTDYDKYLMSQSFLIPKACQKINMDPDTVKFTEEGIYEIIRRHTRGEEGVRELERKLDEIILKLNWVKLTQASQMDSSLCQYHFHSEIKVTFPCVITKKLVTQILKGGT